MTASLLPPRCSVHYFTSPSVQLLVKSGRSSPDDVSFASLPQVEPTSITEDNPWGKRTEEDEAVFNKGLYVMSNMYASPRVLVLQHKRMPPELEEQLEAFGGKPPENRPDLRPYAGEHCRSGWCAASIR